VKIQAIVLAGGYATCLRPTSLSISKHLVPLANRSFVGWVLSQIVEAGMRETFIVGPTIGSKSPSVWATGRG